MTTFTIEDSDYAQAVIEIRQIAKCLNACSAGRFNLLD